MTNDAEIIICRTRTSNRCITNSTGSPLHCAAVTGGAEQLLFLEAIIMCRLLADILLGNVDIMCRLLADILLGNVDKCRYILF